MGSPRVLSSWAACWSRLGSIRPGNALGELAGAEPVGELCFSEVLDDGIDDLDSERRKPRAGSGVPSRGSSLAGSHRGRWGCRSTPYAGQGLSWISSDSTA
jgi:hypothetical protein